MPEDIYTPEELRAMLETLDARSPYDTVLIAVLQSHLAMWAVMERQSRHALKRGDILKRLVMADNWLHLTDRQRTDIAGALAVDAVPQWVLDMEGQHDA